MIKKNLASLSFLFHIMIVVAFAQDKKEFTFEDLGKPIRINLLIELVTNDKEAGPIAWRGLTDANRPL